jgi:hypothetical protein
MAHPILVTGAAGGQQGSTGRVITTLLLTQRILTCDCLHVSAVYNSSLEL